jgi:hypothetical protein
MDVKEISYLSISRADTTIVINARSLGHRRSADRFTAGLLDCGPA